MKTALQSAKAAVQVLVAVLVLVSPAAAPASEESPAFVKHILLFIGDGMQLTHEIAASRYLNGRDDALSFHRLPYRAFVATWDVTTYDGNARACSAPAYDPQGFDPLVGYDPGRGGRMPFPLQPGGVDEAYFNPPPPAAAHAADSASAATALATGFKTESGRIAWAPGGSPNGALETIAERLRAQKGFAIGVVSTVPFSHATPAAFVSHHVSRSGTREIGAEIIHAFQPEVVIGGGHPGSGQGGRSADYSYLRREDHAFLKTPGPDNPYEFVERRAGVDGGERLAAAARSAAAQGRKLFGLFGGAGGGFESPRPRDLPGAPGVERAAAEDPLLSDAVLAALTVLGGDPEGFFAVFEQGGIDWANHDNDFRRMVGTVWDLHTAVAAAVDFIDRPGDAIDWSNTLLIVTADHAHARLRLNAVLAAGDLPEQEGRCGDGGPVCTYPGKEVGYHGTRHTNELVTLYARGGAAAAGCGRAEGLWYPGTRIIDNTQLFHLMAAAAGVPRKSALAPLPSAAGCPRRPAGRGPLPRR